MSGSPLVTASIATLGAGIAVYLAWFDYRRRNDLEFRRELRRGERRHHRKLRDEDEQRQRDKREEIRQMVAEYNNFNLPADFPSRQGIMGFEVEAAQNLLATGGDEQEAAFHFYKALVAAPDKKSILSVYNEQLPKPILGLIGVMIASNPNFNPELLDLGTGEDIVGLHSIPSAGLD